MDILSLLFGGNGNQDKEEQLALAQALRQAPPAAAAPQDDDVSPPIDLSNPQVSVAMGQPEILSRTPKGPDPYFALHHDPGTDTYMQHTPQADISMSAQAAQALMRREPSYYMVNPQHDAPQSAPAVSPSLFAKR